MHCTLKELEALSLFFQNVGTLERFLSQFPVKLPNQTPISPQKKR